MTLRNPLPLLSLVLLTGVAREGHAQVGWPYGSLAACGYHGVDDPNPWDGGTYATHASAQLILDQYHVAWAESGLDDGALHVYAKGYAMYGAAIFRDTLTFYNGSNREEQIPVHVWGDGHRTGNGDVGFQVGLSNGELNYTGNLAGGDFEFFGWWHVPPGLSEQQVSATLWARCAVSGGPMPEMDFGNTLHFGLGSVPGVTWTSSSGVFLTNAVPEPSSLVAIGIGSGLFFRRRRRALPRNEMP